MQKTVRETTSMEETVAFGRELGSALKKGDVVALIGQLGAGKTQLVRGIAGGVGADTRQVASPTFVLMSEYEAPVPVVHIDAYRIESLADLESIGFTSELLDASITLIEWADRIIDELPADHIRVEIIHTEEGRQITVIPSVRDMPRTPCRICGRQTTESVATYPFCSERCRLVDLNKWFKGEYALSRELMEDDED